MKVDVVMGGPGSEAGISRQSGAAVARGLRAAGHDVAVLDLAGRLDPGALRSGAVVFNLVHGTYGEDGELQTELEAAGLPFVGTGSAGSRLCMDKVAAKERVAAAGVPVIPGRLDRADAPCDRDGLDDGRGLVCKPRRDGSSVGLRLLAPGADPSATLSELRRELGAADILVESRLPGPEYTVGLIEDGTELVALPPIRIRPAGGTYDYAAKYESDATEFSFPDDPVTVAALSDMGVRAFRACGCRHLARVDVMADAAGRPCFMEINTLPGFTDHSLLPKAAARRGIGFPELVDRLVGLAVEEGT